MTPHSSVRNKDEIAFFCKDKILFTNHVYAQHS